jgi:hypothetical protein
LLVLKHLLKHWEWRVKEVMQCSGTNESFLFPSHSSQVQICIYKKVRQQTPAAKSSVSRYAIKTLKSRRERKQISRGVS